jgi:hypothetical protein
MLEDYLQKLTKTEILFLNMVVFLFFACFFCLFVCFYFLFVHFFLLISLGFLVVCFVIVGFLF